MRRYALAVVPGLIWIVAALAIQAASPKSAPPSRSLPAAAAHPANFNASNTNNTRDDRSDDKGPEPEGVTVARLFGRQYLFVMLERIGGIVAYELTDPASPTFVDYINTRDFGVTPGAGTGGDLGPEAARVIPAESSPTGVPLLLVSNEVSGSMRVFQIGPRPQ